MRLLVALLLAGACTGCCVSLTPLEERALITERGGRTALYRYELNSSQCEPLQVRAELLIEDQILSSTLQGKGYGFDKVPGPVDFPVETKDGNVARLRYCASMPKGETREFEVLWLRLPEKVTYKLRQRSWGRVASYPALGLPLDLVDIPFTMFRRLGFMDGDTGKTAHRSATGLWVGSWTAAGLVWPAWLIYTTVTPAVVMIPLVVIAVPVGGLIGFNIGAGSSFFLGGVCEVLIGTPQVHLLRHGIRSEDYFPNWKFVAHRPVVTPVGESTVWVVEEVREL